MDVLNESMLVEECPVEFRGDNPWSNYVDRGGSVENWKWKSDDKTKRTRQMDCLMAINDHSSLSNENKRAVMGWMLSEMLTEVPE